MLVLREATTESQIRACWSLNHDAWADGLALDGYVGRELAQLAAHPRDRSRAAYQKFWVLLDDENKDNQGDGGDILSACETVARPALLSVPATGDGDGDGSTGRTIEPGVVWSVASVFCRRSLRGRGYASMMMSSLAASIFASKEEAGEGQGETIGSALFSDVGPDFYARFGWRTHPSTSVTIDLRRLPEVLVFDEEGRGQWIGDGDLPVVCEQDISQIRREFQADPSGDTLFTCLPTCDIIRWHHARMRYVFTHRNVAGEPIDRLGYKVSPESFILWTMQFSHTTDASTLYVLRERHASVKDLATLLARAIETGRAYGMAQVVLWDAKASDVNDAVGLLGLPAEAVEAQTMRQGSISALLLCRRELTDDVVWRNNEKFGWC